ncbi:MAG: SGNH/GDSL hydrolase family protein [Planctomycetes bacterium]|nr:SGNH/GDSL hydrolase family protein [Planctomycetota bacterium]
MAGAWSRRGALALFSSALALGAAEITLRILDLPAPFDQFSFLGQELAARDTFEPDAERFWRINPRAHHVEANPDGFRGNWVDARKSPHEFRIVCVGDSCTFGVGVRYDETFGVRTERTLQRAWPDRVVSTVLLGVPGYSTHQCRVAFVPRAAELAPDLTVLYVGAWNDFGPAVGATDREQAERAGWSRIRRVLDRAVGPDRAELAAEQKDLFVNGNAPARRRVSIDEFRANVEAIVVAARDAGSEVLVVFPTWPRKTIADFPIVLDYSAALRTLAQELGTKTLDTEDLFDSLCGRIPTGWLDEADPRDSLFVDWVHPSPYGHLLLAQGICSTVLERIPRQSAPLRRQSVEWSPPHAALDALELSADLPGLHRVTVGERSLFHIPGTDRWTTPAPLRPGAHVVRWVDDAGLVESSIPLVVQPVQLKASIEPGETELQRRLSIVIRARPGQAVAVWLSTGLASTASPTRYGDFALSTNASGRPAGFEDFPFAFERVGLPGFVGEVDDDGVCSIERVIDVPAGSEGKELWLQGLVRNVGTLDGALSSVEVVRL